MTRRLLLAALAAGFASQFVSAEEPRPAVRIGQVRADETAARAQAPDTTPRNVGLLPPPAPFSTLPVVTENRTPAMPPVYGNIPVTGGPVANGVTLGPPIPINAPYSPQPQVPNGNNGVQPDAPLYGGAPLLAPTSGWSNHWWAGAEYLYWKTEAPTLPVLVTTGPAASNGILGATGTQVLLGDGGFDDTGHNGARFSLGHWFSCNQCWAFEVNGFFIDSAGETFAANSTSFPVLARPFTNLNQGIPFSQVIASPGVSTGGVLVNLDNSLWGIDTNFRKRLSGRSPCFRFEGLVGFRYLNFDEDLTITESFARTPNSPPSIGVPGAVSGTVIDQFSTNNDFYGLNLGLQSEIRRGRWFLNSFLKVGIGEMQQSVTINGSQSILLNTGATTTAAGGLLALPGANIGTFSQNKFAVVPEAGINLGWHITPRLRVSVGYNILYLSSVLRPADQIDTGLDVTRIPNFPVPGAVPLTTVRPTVPLTTTGFYAQGITAGLQFTW